MGLEKYLTGVFFSEIMRGNNKSKFVFKLIHNNCPKLSKVSEAYSGTCQISKP